VEILQQRRMDGIMVGSVFFDDPVVEGLVGAGYPCLMHNPRLRSRRGYRIVLDTVRASCDLTRHLIAPGHRRIGFVSGLPNISTTSERLQGYRTALREAGRFTDSDLIRPGAFRAGTAQAAAPDRLQRRRRPTAIVAGDDPMAPGVIRAASNPGVRIPGEVAGVGFDGIEIAGHPPVQLTAMAQQTGEMGRLAALGILEVIRNRGRLADSPIPQVLAPTLVIRQTCGAGLQAHAGGRPVNAHARSLRRRSPWAHDRNRS
jgi:DNA-binding LacI/PurR family transcriptional regulator